MIRYSEFAEKQHLNIKFLVKRKLFKTMHFFQQAVLQKKFG